MARKQTTTKPAEIKTIAPLSIAADKKAALERIAARHHRSLSAHTRYLIDREIAGEEGAA